MPIYLGSNKISLYRGSNEVSEAYLGSTLVYQNRLPYADGLVIHYDAINNTASGHSSSARSWYDLTGNGYDAEVVLGGSDYWDSNALHVYSDSTRVRVPKEIYTSAFTVEFVIKLESLYNYGTLMRGVQSYAARDAWVGSNGVVSFRVRSSYDGATGSPLSADTLYTVALVRNGNTQKIYINGVLAGSYSRTVTSASNTSFDIFASTTATSRHIRGFAYSFRCYTRELSASEILNNYNVDLARFS